MTDKYTRSAKGKMCQIRIPGVCNHRPETTVLAHLNGGGMSTKHLSIHGSYACSDCHDMVDGRTKRTPGEIKRAMLIKMHLEGVVRTQAIMVEEGVLVL